MTMVACAVTLYNTYALVCATCLATCNGTGDWLVAICEQRFIIQDPYGVKQTVEFFKYYDIHLCNNYRLWISYMIKSFAVVHI